MINFDTLIDNTLVSQKDSATESNAAASESTTQADSGTQPQRIPLRPAQTPARRQNPHRR